MKKFSIHRSDPVINRAGDLPKDVKLPLISKTKVVSSKINTDIPESSSDLDPSVSFDDVAIDSILEEVKPPVNMGSADVVKEEMNFKKEVAASVAVPKELVIPSEEEVDEDELAFLSFGGKSGGKYFNQIKEGLDSNEGVTGAAEIKTNVVEGVCSSEGDTPQIIEQFQHPTMMSKQPHFVFNLYSKVSNLKESLKVIPLTDSDLKEILTKEVALFSLFKIVSKEMCQEVLAKVYDSDYYFDLSFSTPNYFYKGKDHFIYSLGEIIDVGGRQYFVCADVVLSNQKGQVEVFKFFGIEKKVLFN